MSHADAIVDLLAKNPDAILEFHIVPKGAIPAYDDVLLCLGLLAELTEDKKEGINIDQLRDLDIDELKSKVNLIPDTKDKQRYKHGVESIDLLLNEFSKFNIPAVNPELFQGWKMIAEIFEKELSLNDSVDGRKLNVLTTLKQEVRSFGKPQDKSLFASMFGNKEE